MTTSLVLLHALYIRAALKMFFAIIVGKTHNRQKRDKECGSCSKRNEIAHTKRWEIVYAV